MSRRSIALGARPPATALAVQPAGPGLAESNRGGAVWCARYLVDSTPFSATYCALPASCASLAA